MDVLWPPGLESITMYAFENPSPLDGGGAEFQDSGLGYASVTEVDMKEHAIGKESTGPSGSSRKINNRDPRRRLVTIASPATLYGATASPTADPVNVAESAYKEPHRVLHPWRTATGHLPWSLI